MYANNSHSYTHLILALDTVRKPTVWDFITSQYPGIQCHDIGLFSCTQNTTADAAFFTQNTLITNTCVQA